MTTRELFEAEFECPPGIIWTGFSWTRRPMHPIPKIETLRDYKNKWIGFQAGYKAGKENTNA